MWSPPRLEDARILLYEPCVYSRTVIREQLFKMRVREIQYAHTPLELENKLLASEIHITIVDWTANPEDRIAVPRVLKESKDNHWTESAIILITGDRRRKTFQLALSTGVAMVVVKPFSIRSFCERLIWVAGKAGVGQRPQAPPPPKGFVIENTPKDAGPRLQV